MRLRHEVKNILDRCHGLKRSIKNGGEVRSEVKSHIEHRVCSCSTDSGWPTLYSTTHRCGVWHVCSTAAEALESK